LRSTFTALLSKGWCYLNSINLVCVSLSSVFISLCCSLATIDIKIRGALSHPNLLRYSGICIEEDVSVIYVLSELVCGDTLASLVEVRV
jgi:hypothetical protein